MFRPLTLEKGLYHSTNPSMSLVFGYSLNLDSVTACPLLWILFKLVLSTYTVFMNCAIFRAQRDIK